MNLTNTRIEIPPEDEVENVREKMKKNNILHKKIEVRIHRSKIQ